MDEAELKKARFYALKVINFRPRSIGELKDKLKEKGFPDNITIEVLAEFSKKGLLNDVKFSKLWVNSRLHSNPKGNLALKRELKEKGIEDNIINKVIAESREEKSEYETAKGLADSRMNSMADLDKKTAKRRLFGYLKRRGFDFEVIMKVLDEEFSKKRNAF